MLRVSRQSNTAMANAADLLSSRDQQDASEPNESDSQAEDDRSSSLSDPDDVSETASTKATSLKQQALPDADSEAETERLHISPEKATAAIGVLHRRPSNLMHNMVPIEPPEIEQFSDSAISSPAASDVESLSDDLQGEDDGDARMQDVEEEVQQIDLSMSSRKRKRQLLEDDIGSDTSAGRMAQRRRTHSFDDDDDDDDDDDNESESKSNVGDDKNIEEDLPSRDGTAEPTEEMQQDGAADSLAQGDNEDDEGDLLNSTAQKREAQSVKPIRFTRGNAPKLIEPIEEDEDLPDHEELGQDSEDEVVADDADDAEATAKSEEEYAKRMAAMESLAALENHFAALRDRLYDERIAVINAELVQLAGSKSTHPELLKQIKCVQKYRDEKFEVEQKLLVYKVGALKTKSVAERSQIHSAYFQSVRDIREKHLERASERFYRIQRDRFRTEDEMPKYYIPFPERRSQRINNQAAYNKEVSILAGVAKYVGFPAAPELVSARQIELEEDLEKMGISIAQAKPPRAARGPLTQSAFVANLTRPAAEEQFLEQTPWANPQHPAHRQHLSNLSRQLSEQKTNESTTTPAIQRLSNDPGPIVGSASTIVENTSAPASSAFSTPFGPAAQDGHRNGEELANERLHSPSPSELQSRNHTGASRVYSGVSMYPSQQYKSKDFAASGRPTTRIELLNSPSSSNQAIGEMETRAIASAPSQLHQQIKSPGIMTSPSMSGFGVR